MFFHELQNRNSCLCCFDLPWITYLQVWKKVLNFIAFKDWLWVIVPAICFFWRKFLTKQKMSKTNKGTWTGNSLPERLDFVYLNKTISIDDAFVEKLSKTTFAMSVFKSVQGKGMRWVLALHPINNKGCIPKRQQRSGNYKSINISHVLSTSSHLV